MRINHVFLLALLMLAASGYTGDLFLVDPAGESQLKIVKQHVECAHGMIAGKFIVHIDSEQQRVLQRAGLELNPLARDIGLEDIYLVEEGNRTLGRTVVSFTPVYSIGGRHLVVLEKSSVDILDRAGYFVRPLTELRTPFFYRKPIYPAPLLEDYPSDTLADLVVLDSLQSYVQRLEDFYTRFTPTDSNHASRDWIKAKFESFGYDDVSLHAFHSTREWMGVYNVRAWNVICKKVGTQYPDDWIIVGGHYDSFAYGCESDPYYFAPGADDDATGVATALELARIFHDLPTKKSYMFCGFGAEEQLCDGTDSMAYMLHNQGVKVEYVLNIDMIAWEEDGIYDVWSYTTGRPYHDVFAGAAARLNSVEPVYQFGARWDAGPFVYYGACGTTLHEKDEYPVIHTDFDLTDSLDFDYMTEVVRTAAATLPVIDASALPPECQVYDVGDGQTIKVTWDSCLSQHSYQILCGPAGNNLTDTVDVPSGQGEINIPGLTEGQNYFFTVYPIPDDGYPPLYHVFSEITPLSVPRIPDNLTAEPVLNGVSLLWNENQELDFDHYKVLRRPVGGVWEAIADNLSDTGWVDTDISPAQEYSYTVLAVDGDFNESDSAVAVNCVAATFDQGILLADETQAGDFNPSESEQNFFYGSLLVDYGVTKYTIESNEDPLTRSLSGQYNPVIYVDDDNLQHHLASSLDTLEWYLDYGTDLFLAGWETIYVITGQTHFYEGDFFYDQLGLSYVARNVLQDFTGATGESDWPDLVLKPGAPFGGRLPNIQIFTGASGAEVIARFDSYSGNAFYDNKPVGIAYDTYDGKRVVLGCPLYWLTEASAQALIQRVMEYFAAPSVYVNGDVNDDRIVNLLDITYLIAYLYQGGPAPARINHGDPNGDCTINILDVSYLISYLYMSGPAPVDGCVE